MPFEIGASRPSWSQFNTQSSETTERLIEVVYGDGTFVALGENGLILTATGATTWTHRTSLAGGPFWKDFGVAFGNGTFVIGVKDVCYSSQDGITWSVSALTAPGVIGGIAFGNGIFVSVGRTGDEPEDGGAVFTSADGAVWTQQATIPAWEVGVGVFFANGQFITFGKPVDPGSPPARYNTLVSPDGITWTVTDSIYLTWLTTAGFGNGTYVAMGDGIAVSRDGLAWEETWAPEENLEVFGISFGASVFVAVGRNGRILTSPDGITWSVNPFGLGQAQVIEKLASAGDTFILVGLDETILQSDPILNRECIPFLSVTPSAGSLPAASGKRFSLPATEPFSVSIGLWPLRVAGSPADWWVLADTPFGWYSYVYPGQWYPTLSILTAHPAYQGPLSYLESFPVLTISGLSAGRYTFYFGVDLLLNGVLDATPLFYDHVTVEVGAAVF